MMQKPLTVEDICNKLRPVFGEKIDKVYFQYSVAESREEREEIAHILNTLYQKHLSQLLDQGVLLEPPRKELIDGDYSLATISYAQKQLYDFTLREKDFPRHICVTGMSGSGKTTFAFNIIDSLNKHKKPYLIFDWKKSFRPLSTEDSSIMTFTVGDDSVANLFKTNINRPPKGVSPKEWVNVLSDLLTEAFSASFGVHKVILETLDESFKEWGIYDGSDNYPTWNHIKWRLEEKVEKSNARESGWIESALRIATILTFGEFGKVVNYKGKNAFTVEELLDKRVVMELNSLGNIEKTFFCDFVLTYIYKMKKARQNHANQIFDHAIIVDEAHNIFLKKPTSFANESVTDMIYREMREYGTSLVCLDQHVSKISDTVKGNSACHIAFQQQLPADIQDISGIMDIRDNKNYFTKLPVGSAIVKLAERYPAPFLIETKYADIRDKDITNEEIKSRMKALMLNRDYANNVDPEFNKKIEAQKEEKVIEVKQEEKKTEPKVESEFNEVEQMIMEFATAHLEAGMPLEKVEEILEKSKQQGGYTSLEIMKIINHIFNNQLMVTFKSSKNSESSSLDSDGQVFMEFLIKNPEHNLTTVQVYQEIGLGARRGTKTKNKLLEMGLIKIQEIKYDKGWKKIIRPTN